MKQELHLIYGLTHPDAPGMEVLYVGSDRMSGNRVELHQAGQTKLVSRGCVKFGLAPALLNAHILEFWTDESPEYEWIREMKTCCQAEFNPSPNAPTSEMARMGGLAAAAWGRSEVGREQKRRAGRKGARSQPRAAKAKGGRNQPRVAKAKGGRNQPRVAKAKGGRINKKNGTGVFAPGMSAKGGHIAGRISKENGTGVFAPGMQAKGGRIGGRITRERGTGIFVPGMQAKGGQKSVLAKIAKYGTAFPPGAARKGGCISGRKSAESGRLKSISNTGRHQRWHVRRGIVDPACSLCQEGMRNS